MSNRAKWARRDKAGPREGWPTRLLASTISAAVGVFLVFASIEGIRGHVLWYTRFDPRFGRFVLNPTTDLMLLASFFFALSIAAWLERK
jgi:hypothetical protein